MDTLLTKCDTSKCPTARVLAETELRTMYWTKCRANEMRLMKTNGFAESMRLAKSRNKRRLRGHCLPPDSFTLTSIA